MSTYSEARMYLNLLRCAPFSLLDVVRLRLRREKLAGLASSGAAGQAPTASRYDTHELSGLGDWLLSPVAVAGAASNSPRELGCFPQSPQGDRG
jgi:hypothetical protein